MKRALKQAKAYRDKLLQLSTADYELRKADSEFIGLSPSPSKAKQKQRRNHAYHTH